MISKIIILISVSYIVSVIAYEVGKYHGYSEGLDEGFYRGKYLP